VIPPAMDPAAKRGGLPRMIFSQISAIRRSLHRDGLYNTAHSMHRQLPLMALLCMIGLRPLWAETEISAPEADNERQETTSDLEWEAKGVIPQGGLTVSTQPVTPISILPVRNPYDQGLEELALAQDLWKKGKAEAASDVALQAYDDLMSMSLGRRNKKKRQKLRTERHQAATVYIESSIAYIEDYVKKAGGGHRATDEGRARLGDLRDVSQNYPELTKKLNKALEAYTVHLSTQAVTAVSVSTAAAISTSSVKN